MKYTPLTKLAMEICFEAHKDQQDKSGLPYVFHPIHVAEQMETELEICTALLHDVVEDTQLTFANLRDFPQPILDALQLLTHDPAVPYLDYIAALAHNPIARAVKIADLQHNCDLTRLDVVTDQDRVRAERYAAALQLLTAAD